MDLKAHLQNNSISSKDFDTLAKLLLNKSVIRVGNKNYRLLEIEFYLYSSSHPDLITYPRIDNEGGHWFFHQSGVDICFHSNCKTTENNQYCLDDSNKFGGILIRSMVEIGCDINKKAELKPIHGPLKCLDELFKTFGALENNRNVNQIPIIDECSSLSEERVMKTQRYIRIINTAEDKIKSILKYTYNCEGADISSAAELIKKDTPYLYRYYIEPKEVQKDVLWKNYPAKPKNGIHVS
ncbi:MAG: hypothetical protein IKI47_00110 [Prevotella sp.]|nr:hypothetical protein [Prevotella sp.]